MKSNFKSRTRIFHVSHLRGSLAAAGLLAAGLALFVGCSSKTPFDSGYPGAYTAPNSVPNRNRVDQFTIGSTSINPNLMEMNNAPSYALKTAGSIMTVNNFGTANASANFASGGPNGEPFALQVQGAVTDLGNSAFPTIDLEAQMEGGNLYDGSFFTGVKFYLKIANDDSTLKRTFAIPIYQTQGAPQGGCVVANGGCYDHFSFDLTPGTGGQWKLFTMSFVSMQPAFAGVKTNPPDFTGANLQQMLWLQWEEGRNNTAGISNVDFSVDDIEFY